MPSIQQLPISPCVVAEHNATHEKHARVRRAQVSYQFCLRIKKKCDSFWRTTIRNVKTAVYNSDTIIFIFFGHCTGKNEDDPLNSLRSLLAYCFITQGRPGLFGARGDLGQDRYFKYFLTNANQITVVDALRYCLLAHRNSMRSMSNAVFYQHKFVFSYQK